MRAAAIALAYLLWASSAGAQAVSHSGFIEGRLFGFPQEAPNDAERVIGDALLREEVFLRPSPWLQIEAGVDLRANSHGEVEDEWRLDLEDRTLRRPRAAVRRLAAGVATRGFSVDVGKQFVRWGRTDVIQPTDRFAPRDFLNVIDSGLLPVIGARAALQVGSETFEAVWSPQLTPSRLPLLNRRWAAVPPEVPIDILVDDGSDIPGRALYGARWRHTGSRVEAALAYFDGPNHLPDIELRPGADGTIGIVRVHPEIRMYGGDLAIPTRVVTLKAETAVVTSRSRTSDDYVLYVVEIERQIGEWLIDVGYAGEVVTEARVPLAFAPDRQLARSVIGRAAYVVDPRRTVVIEGAARQRGEGVYAKLEYSQAVGRYWRLTFTGVGLTGDPDDFLGQYRRNSHGSVTLRFSF
jgi:hydrogenase maturation factor